MKYKVSPERATGMDDTLARLRDTLTTIARQQDITIIAARDIGSHAWELAGPASDPQEK